MYNKNIYMQILNNKNQTGKKGDDKKIKNKFSEFLKNWWLTILIFFLFFISPILNNYFDKGQTSVSVVPISEIVIKINEGEVESLDVRETEVLAHLIASSSTVKANKESGESIGTILKNLGVDETALSDVKIDIIKDAAWKSYVGVFSLLLPIIFFGLLIFMIMRSVKGVNSQALSFGNSRAKKINPEDKNQKVTFVDVAGAKVAKQELAEVVEFLKEPKKFLDIGATIPKGVMLTGAPGTGKTLLARAVAGEAGVPFYHLSGSEFVEMFVGVGASRVRDLFADAKKNAPAIIFIDEIDSVGRSRGVGMGGGNDEREQTLNQILVEMDGFEANEKVIVIAATNRADVLDTALMRPGRFDRRVNIDLPDRAERKEILEVHIKGKKLAEDVNLDVIAQRTPGFSGAELQSLLNEAAILAAREKRTTLAQFDAIRSIEKVMLGPERQSHIMGEEEKKVVAYHEAGHALVASLLANADPVHKISIISRGSAGGYTIKLPTDERRLTNKKVFIDDIAMTFGGYAAEEFIFGDVTTGPSGDIEQATAMARAMVTRYGMSDVVGPIAIESEKNTLLYGRGRGDKDYSESMNNMIDAEIKRIVEDGRTTARTLVRENKKALDDIANTLIEKEILERDDFEKILILNGIALKK
jgi:cell division protease FtsH